MIVILKNWSVFYPELELSGVPIAINCWTVVSQQMVLKLRSKTYLKKSQKKIVHLNEVIKYEKAVYDEMSISR